MIHLSKGIMIIAGEASGDMHGANLVKAMLKKDRTLSFYGIGGKRLKEAGVRIDVDADDLSVVGITEALFKLPTVLNGMTKAKRLLRHCQPALLILIDFPDFNLHIAAYAKKLNIPVLYYISPQVWAWRSGRVKIIKERVDHMAVILPFEASFYRKHKVPVTYVGHPLLDTCGSPKLRDNVKTPGNDDKPFIIGILPGSRNGEILRHLSLMLESAVLTQKRYPHKLSFLISKAASVNSSIFQEILKKYSHVLDYECVDNIEKVFKRADFVIASSGTVTLETALWEIPMVIVYRVSPVSAWLGKRLSSVSHIGLANLILGDDVVPELIQEEATPKNIADAALDLICDTKKLNWVRRRFNTMRCLLGSPGVADRTAKLAMNLINGQTA